MLSYALWAYGHAFHDADPAGALEALRRGLVIAQDSGNRGNETTLAASVSRLEAEYGDPLAALNYLMMVIRNFHDAGNTTLIRSHAGYPRRPFRPTRTPRTSGHHRRLRLRPHHRGDLPEINTAITHLRDVLGEATYESLARKGETMTTAEMATYAYDQIDQARTELEHPS